MVLLLLFDLSNLKLLVDDLTFVLCMISIILFLQAMTLELINLCHLIRIDPSGIQLFCVLKRISISSFFF